MQFLICDCNSFQDRMSSRSETYTYNQIKNEILDLLSKEQYEYSHETSDKNGHDLRSLLIEFACQVKYTRMSPIERTADELGIQGFEKSFMKACGLDKEELQNSLSSRDRQIVELSQQLCHETGRNQELAAEVSDLKQTIKQLCSAYTELKQIHSQQTRRMDWNLSGDKSSTAELADKLFISESHIKNLESKTESYLHLIDDFAAKCLSLEKQNNYLKLEIEHQHRKVQILQSNNAKKKQKIGSMLGMIESKNQKKK